MVWYKVTIFACNTPLNYYSELPVAVNDRVIVETRHGPMEGRVLEVTGTIDFDPFKPNKCGCKATKHVLENITKKIYKEELNMFGCKTVKVKHTASEKVGVFYTDLELKNGDKVVYESTDGSMHVGTVIDNDPDIMTAKNYIVDVVETTAYTARLNAIKEAEKIRAKLELKKKQFQDMELLRLIAANDAETAELLKQYTKITSGGKQ